MFFVISKIFEFFTAPSHVAVFIAALGAALCYTRYVKWGRRLAAVATTSLSLAEQRPFP